MDANFPILDPKACPKCSKKPCQAFAKAYTKSVVLVGTNEVPINCPLKVSQHELGRFSIGLSDITMAEVNRARSNNGRSFGSNRFNQYTSPKEIILALSIRGEISILGAMYGSPANRQLTAWATAKTSLYRKAVEEKLEAEAAEVEKEKVKPRLFNPTWVWLADPKKPDCEEKSISEGTLYDSVWCKVDTEGLMPSDGVTYAIFLKAAAGGEDTKLTTLSGRVGEGRRDNAAVAGWMFEAKYAGKPLALDKDELYFIARRQSDNLEVTSGKIKVGPQKGDCAEVHDSLFDHNSALMALSPVGAADAFEALNILADALIYATDHEDRECLIYGHADTTGDAAYNVEISKLRAQSVRALLDGKKEDWVSIALKKGSNESLEKYLLAFHHAFGWECDPGIVDGTFSAATKAAVENFQSSFNGEHDGHLEVDGNMGRESWGAVFHILEEQLGLLVEAKGRDPKKLRMRYAAQDGGIVACGEKYPVDAKEKDGFKSQKNRRVEIAFVDAARGVPKTRDQVRLVPMVPKKDKVVQKIKRSITVRCQHVDEGKERRARIGQCLEVVPKLMSGDTLSAEGAGTDASQIIWRLGEKEEKGIRGQVATIVAPSIANPVRIVPKFSDLVHLIKGEFKDIEGCHPREEYLIAQYPDLEEKKILVKIYPHAKISHTFGEDDEEEGHGKKKSKWAAASEAAEKITHRIQEACKYVDNSIELKFEKFEFNGKITGEFKEEKDSPRAFYQVTGSMGLNPLIGMDLKIPFRLPFDRVPDWVHKYIYDIYPALTLKGEINGNAEIQRETLKYFTGKGEVEGGIGIGVSLNVNVFGGKLIDAKLECRSGISVTGGAKNFRKELSVDHPNNDAILEFSLVVTFKGIVGDLIITTCSGKIELGSEKLELVKEQELWKRALIWPNSV